MRWSLLGLGLAVVLMVAAAQPASAECGFFYRQNVQCQGFDAVISWQAVLNGTCDNFDISLQRKCGNGQWVTIADPATSPYTDHIGVMGCGAGFYYRLKITCVCDNQQIENYSSVMGPIRCP